MKQPSLLQFTGFALATILPTILARADVPIYQDKISLYGYAAGSLAFREDKYLRGVSSDTDNPFTLDAAKLGAAFNFDPVTARLSVYVPRPDNVKYPDNIYLLEANVTYTMRGDSKITIGRFQSSIGYESFDIPNGSFITAGTGDSMNAPGLNLIPNFHEGVKFEGTTNNNYGYGIALVDSIYNTTGKPFRGDGSLSDGFGFELYGKYHSENLSGQMTLGYQSNKLPLAMSGTAKITSTGETFPYPYSLNTNTDTWIVDLYGEYKVPNSKVTLGFEGAYRTDDPAIPSFNGKRFPDREFPDAEPATVPAQDMSAYNKRVITYFVLAMMKYQVSEPFFIAARFSTGQKKAQTDANATGYFNTDTRGFDYVRPDGVVVLFYKYTVAASYTVSKNVELRAELSTTDYMKTRITDPKGNIKQISDSYYAGVQAILKF